MRQWSWQFLAISGLLLLASTGVETVNAQQPEKPAASASNAAKLPSFDSLWNFGNPEESERKFRELLPAAKASGDVSYLLQLETQIARALGLQGKFDACHATLDAVDSRLKDDQKVARVRYLLERGRAFNSAGQPAKAIPLFTEAWKVAEAAQESKFAIDAVHMLAIAEPDRSAQAAWGEKGLKLVAGHPGNEKWLPALYNNLGETYRALKKYDKALDCFENLAEIDRQAGRPADMYTTKDIAKMHRLLGKHERALELMETVVKDLKAKKQSDGYISAEYGECLLAAGRKTDAKPYLFEAFELLSKDPYMVQHEPDELSRLKTLAGIGKK